MTTLEMTDADIKNEIKELFQHCKNDRDCKKVVVLHHDDYPRETLLRIFLQTYDHHVSMLLNEQMNG
jgi:Icc-related predicted phosphoesterase